MYRQHVKSLDRFPILAGLVAGGAFRAIRDLDGP
jgi:hypothetical protein